jgi:hypothetical protein
MTLGGVAVREKLGRYGITWDTMGVNGIPNQIEEFPSIPALLA